MISQHLVAKIEEFVDAHGEIALLTKLGDAGSMVNDRQEILTVIANQSLHEIPGKYVHGEVFIVSEGNLDFGSKQLVEQQFKDCLLKLKKKLNEKSWKKVHLIPTGHPTLALQIKNLVYHILRLDTIDLFYSQGNYFELDLKRADFL